MRLTDRLKGQFVALALFALALATYGLWLAVFG